MPINVDLDLNLDVDVDLLSGDKLLHAQPLSGYGSLLIACGAAERQGPRPRPSPSPGRESGLS